MKTNDELQKDVMAEIRWDPKLADVHTQIGVAAKDGVITLSGLVDTYSKKLAAERAAQRVQGVKVVASDMEVKLGTLGNKTDTEIAEALNNALRWSSAVNEDKIEVKVENGWVTLSGEVDWNFQKTYAERCVEDLMGVKGVTNIINIQTPSINTSEIQEKITKAFQRNATVDAATIKLETAGNKVTLRGKVMSYAEKEEAEKIAWSSPGVQQVDNQIEIDLEVFA